MSKIDWSSVKTLAQKLAEKDQHDEIAIASAVQAYLDNGAKARKYDNILSLCTYATSSVPRFAAEGQAGVQWRDAVWEQCYALLEEYKAGNISKPTAQAVIATLPAINWPQ